jgi:hypothetical protein
MPTNTEDFAVVVGINDYQKPPFAPLQGACADAVDFVDWLQSPNGGDLPAQNIKLTTYDPQNPAPSESYIKTLIADLLGIPPKPDTAFIGRRLYLFFAGHGIGQEEELDDTGFAAIDASKYLDAYIFGAATANKIALMACFQEIVLFMDCCRVLDNRVKRSAVGLREK